MVRRVIIEEFGGPDVMKLADRELPKLAAGQIAVKSDAIGLNFIDTYHRSGLYPISLPSGLGLEAAGIVTAVADDVTGFKEGDRVGYFSGPLGAYSEVNHINASQALKLPDEIGSDVAAASMLKGLTVQYLIRQIYPVKAGETVLFHAAAGGVGLIACQWLKALGAEVIGTVSSEEKAALAKSAGCDHIIRYDVDSVSKKVAEITGGKKLPVVFDGVGAATWEESLDSLQPRGLMVSFGNASGAVTGVNLGILAAKGSLFVTRPKLFDYTATRPALESAAEDFFSVLASGDVKVDIRNHYELADIVKAHQDLEGRKTTGSTVITP